MSQSISYPKINEERLVLGMFISFVIHGLALGAIFYYQNVLTSYQPANVVSLQIDLFGLIGDLQVEGREGDVPEIEEPEPPPEPLPVIPEPEPEPEPIEPAPVPPEAVLVPEEPKPEPKPVPQPRPVRKPPPKPKNTGEERRAQRTTKRDNSDATVMRQYMRELARLVRSKMVYPTEAKFKGESGEAKVAFIIMENGQLKPQSVKISKSSGFASIDRAALRAVESVGVFPKPPHVIDAVISLDFSMVQPQ
ncbi:MAG: energy transducer TonB [Deltaproteobacteria bacterium]|jgi:protein TonB|nr:energy transducer TonB [Deltaproteobacteria bacterium]